MYDAILHQNPARPSLLNPALPAEFDQVVSGLLEKDRTLRYQTAAEVRANLKRLQRTSEPGQPMGTQLSRSPRLRRIPNRRRRYRRRRRRRRQDWGAGQPGPRWQSLAAVLLIGVALAYWWSQRSTAPTGIDSIAVLPFAASGAPAESEYLTDGITETLINGLSQLPGLRVSARSVVFRYKGKDIDPQQVGRDLGVKVVVTGGLRFAAIGSSSRRT